MKYQPLILFQKRFDEPVFGFDSSILKSIQREVESRERIENGSGLGVFLPGRPGETGLF